MSFLSDPIGNISGGLSSLGHTIANNPIADMALAAAAMAYGIPPELTIPGLGSAGTVAAGIGGISALTTGNLGKGLQAGLAAYGGASAYQDLIGTTVPGGAPVETHVPTNVENIPGSPSYSASPVTPGGGYNYMPAGANASNYNFESGQPIIDNPATAGQVANNPLSANTKTPVQSASLWQQYKDATLPTQLGIGALAMAGLKAAATPQKLNAPAASPSQIVKKIYNPYTGQMTTTGIYCAAQYNANQPVSAPVYGATGGLVALANGGAVHGYRSYADGGVPEGGYIAGNGHLLVPDGGADENGNPTYNDMGVPQGGTATNTEGGLQPVAPAVQALANNTTQANIPTTSGSGLQPIGPAVQALANTPTVASSTPTSSVDTTSPVMPTTTASPAVTSTPANNLPINSFANTGNPNINNDQIAAAYKAAMAPGGGGYNQLQQEMQKYGVSVGQIAQALGVSTGVASQDYSQTVAAQNEASQLGQAPANTPFANDPQWAAYMDKNNLSTGQMAAITGLSKNEVDARYDLVQAQKAAAAATAATATTPTTLTKPTSITDLPTTATIGGTGSGTTITGTGTGTGSGSGSGSGSGAGSSGSSTGTGGITTLVDNSGVTNQTAAHTATGYTPATSTQPVLTDPVHKALADGIGGTTGAGQVGGGTVVNPNGTVTSSPVIAGIPVGGFTGMQQMVNDYTKGGGSTGYTNPVLTAAQANALYGPAAGSEQAENYAYLMGQTSQQPILPPTTSLMQPYFATAQLKYGTKLPGGMMANKQPDGSYLGADNKKYNIDGTPFVAAKAGGGLMALASGGMPMVGHLGGYSDGGRLLRGPGDGVSDSIPATIGSHDPEPARLADGEFVVPARIVSELGNGSTEAGARQLYKMMDRIQNARQKTVGKDRVAANTNAHQYLPA